jgi:hypothetical protein
VLIPVRVRVVVVAPETTPPLLKFTPFFCHWKVTGAAPLISVAVIMMLSPAIAPTEAVGWTEKDGGVPTPPDAQPKTGRIVELSVLVS